MVVELIVALAVAALCAAGWLLAELELRDVEEDLAAAEHDLDVALGWQEALRPTLTVLDGRDA